MREYIISDLVMEGAEWGSLKGTKNGNAEQYSEDCFGEITVCRLRVDKDGERYRKGRYVTVYSPKIYLLDSKGKGKLSSILAGEVKKMLEKSLNKRLDGNTTILVAGVGNRQITPDAIGPMCVEKISVTRHIKRLDSAVFGRMGRCTVCAVACGVMAQTGMDTAEILRGVVSECEPSAVVAIDALAARECEALGSTVQISDSGIVPGAGVGNRQSVINAEALGVPVIVIGVPTVVSAATLIGDTLTQNDVVADVKIREILDARKNFFVAPKECDLLCESASDVVAQALDIAFEVI